MSLAIEAAFKAISVKLGQAAGNFGTQIYRELAAAEATYPYAVMSWAGGGDDNVRKAKKTANILIQVKVMSINPSQSYTGAQTVDTALDDAGYQDTEPTASALDVAAQVYGWRICTVTAEDTVVLVEPFENTKRLYHTGKVYRLIMEES